MRARLLWPFLPALALAEHAGDGPVHRIQEPEAHARTQLLTQTGHGYRATSRRHSACASYPSPPRWLAESSPASATAPCDRRLRGGGPECPPSPSFSRSSSARSFTLVRSSVDAPEPRLAARRDARVRLWTPLPDPGSESPGRGPQRRPRARERCSGSPSSRLAHSEFCRPRSLCLAGSLSRMVPAPEPLRPSVDVAPREDRAYRDLAPMQPRRFFMVLPRRIVGLPRSPTCSATSNGRRADMHYRGRFPVVARLRAGSVLDGGRRSGAGPAPVSLDQRRRAPAASCTARAPATARGRDRPGLRHRHRRGRLWRRFAVLAY